MPIYQYAAKDLRGKTKKGKLVAVDEQLLTQSLREDGLYLISAHALPGEETNTYRLKADVLSDFCRQLGTMLKSGVSLVRAMNIMLQRDLNKQQRKIYTGVYQMLQQGHTLSESMEGQGKAFPELLVNMVRAGESSGQLDKTAMKMSTHYEKEHRLNGKVKNAALYPVILLIVTFLVMILLFTVVLPEFFDLFANFDAELPLMTRIVMAISNFLIQYWYVVLIAALCAVAVCSMLLRIPKVRIAVDKAKLRVPKIGKLLQIIYTARFARTLCSLYSGGLSMINALHISADTIGNRYISSQFDEVVAQVRNGTPLSRAIQPADGFDPKLFSSIFIGEETGRLDEMLDNIADDFDYESEIATQKMVTVLEPVLIVLLALMVGFVMLSVMTPIWGLYNAIG